MTYLGRRHCDTDMSICFLGCFCPCFWFFRNEDVLVIEAIENGEVDSHV
ncbi:unnamed protein product [Brassica oleracea var. botrytis]